LAYFFKGFSALSFTTGFRAPLRFGHVAAEHANHFRDTEQCNKNLAAISARKDTVRTVVALV